MNIHVLFILCVKVAVSSMCQGGSTEDEAAVRDSFSFKVSFRVFGGFRSFFSGVPFAAFGCSFCFVFCRSFTVFLQCFWGGR